MTDLGYICELYRDGMKIIDIARLLHCDNRLVSRVLHDEGVQLRYHGFGDGYVPTEEEIESRSREVLEQRGTVLQTGMLADAH